MAAANRKLLELANDDRHVLESMLVQFDQSWTEDSLSARVRELPPSSQLRLPALVEMVKIDLERQWQRGRPITLEEYLSCYPELGTRDTVAPDLIQAEYEVRCQFDSPVGLSELVQRFPRHADQLRRLVGQSQRIGSPDDLAISDTVSSHDDTAGPRGGAVIPIAPAQAPSVKSSNQPRGQRTGTGQDWCIGQLPERFGRYRVLKCLGQGGMGAVYLAHDTQLERQVAIKVPHFDCDAAPEVLERVYREARAAATLDHPNICPVYDVGEIDGQRYLVMAYIQGKPLSDFVRADKPIALRQVAAIVRKLALALHEAHTHGVVHRDLKPANIMANKRRELVIMDFGLARLTKKSPDGERRLTHSGVIMGTPAYMSPEQVMGDTKAVGTACDIYALGVIMYELLTGRLPFQGVFTAVLAQIAVDQPTPPSNHRADIDSQLETICLRAMAKRIEDRYSSMADLASALGDYLAGRVAGVESSSSPQPSSLPKQTLRSRRDQPSRSAGADFVLGNSEMSNVPAADAVRPRKAPRRERIPSRAVSQTAVSRVADENLDEFFAAMVGEDTPLPRSKPSRRAVNPHWPWLATAGAAALLLLGGIIYISTNKGMIKIELDVPDAVVKVDGDVITIERLGEPITLRAGEHELVVKRGDIEMETQKFTVRRGNNPVLRAELVPKLARNTSGIVPDKSPVKTTDQPQTTAATTNDPTDTAVRQPIIKKTAESDAKKPATRVEPLPRDRWIQLDANTPDATSWVWKNNKRKSEQQKWDNDVLTLENRAIAFNSIQAKDISFRAQVKFIEGNNMGLIVRGRHGAGGGGIYALFDRIEPGKMFITVLNTKDSKVVNLKDDFFEYRVNAVGDLVTLQVNGQTVVEHQTKDLQVGHVSITAFDAKGMFKDMEVKILDK